MAFNTIERKYRFYAAHRNQFLTGTKCERLHGHSYMVKVLIKIPYSDSVVYEFSKIDEYVEPIIKRLDHRTLLDNKDPLVSYLEQAISDKAIPEDSLVLFNSITSVENISKWIFNRIKSKGLPVFLVSVSETLSSDVSYGE